MIARLFSQFKYLICFSGLPDQRPYPMFSRLVRYKRTKVCFCEGPVTTRKFYVGFVKLYIPCIPAIQVSQVNYYHVKIVAFVYA